MNELDDLAKAYRDCFADDPVHLDPEFITDPNIPPGTLLAPPAPLGSGLGILGATVWPTYIGLSCGEPGPGTATGGTGIPSHESHGDLDYKRGMITWVTEASGLVWGQARVYVPKGVYTHVLFCHGPGPNLYLSAKQWESPVVFNKSGWIDINPIHNADVLPRLSP